MTLHFQLSVGDDNHRWQVRGVTAFGLQANKFRFNLFSRQLEPFSHHQSNTPLNPVTAQMLLLKCYGNEIWNEETCRSEGIPDSWIEELIDNYESGFDTDRNTIYENDRMVNQYRGVLDLHLAYKLAEYLGIDWQKATATALGREAQVAAIKAELDEL